MTIENKKHEVSDDWLELFLKKNIVKILSGLFVLGAMAGMAILSVYFYNFNGQISSDQNIWGVFGDYVGGALNPIFGFLGFIALLITIVFQSKELSLSSEELKKSATALEKQSLSLELQNFESTFFNMLRLHNEIVQDMKIEVRQGEEILVQEISGGEFKIVYDRSRCIDEYDKFFGRDCLKYMNRCLVYSYGLIEKHYPHSDPDFIIRISYKTFFKDFGYRIGHYFRNLFHIVKFIDESHVENKRRYIRIVRAQLSDFELNLLFYNSFSAAGSPFKAFIEKYALLKNFNPDTCIRPFLHIRLYKDGAYGGRKGLEQYFA